MTDHRIGVLVVGQRCRSRDVASINTRGEELIMTAPRRAEVDARDRAKERTLLMTNVTPAHGFPTLSALLGHCHSFGVDGCASDPFHDRAISEMRSSATAPVVADPDYRR